MSETNSSAPFTTRSPLERVTLMDVAKIAGVSKVAASVVLSPNAQSKVKVSEATRQRILDAARELKYQPNVLARSLRHRTTNVIGFYSLQGFVFDPVIPFYAMLLRGILRGCDDQRKNLMMHGAFNRISEDDIYQELHNGQLDGLILYARDKTPLVERLIESQLPVVSVVNEIPSLPCVTIDHELGGRLLARHLAQSGYQRVVYATANRVVPSTIESRYQAFSTEAKAQGISVQLCNLGDGGNIDPDLAREIVLTPQKRPQVIACFNDFTADQLFAICAEQGIRVPDDIAITGFDGFGLSHRSAPNLTTVRAPWDEVARKAVEILVAQCNGESVPLKTTLPVEFVTGETA